MNTQTLVWDEYDIAQGQARFLIEQGEHDNEDDAFNAARGDSDLYLIEFDYFLECFTDILQEISPGGHFFIEGTNMGWRHLSGTLGLTADCARSFIEQAFPKTNEWTLRGEYDPQAKTLSYRLSHHDAPTGECYTLKEGYKHPADDEIMAEKPVIEITVAWCDFPGTWAAEDTTGEWSYADTKAQAIAEARRMSKLWREDGYKTKLIIRNKHS